MSLEIVSKEICKSVYDRLIEGRRSQERSPNLDGWCAIGSAMACCELLSLGFVAKMVEGYNYWEGHCWVELSDGTVVDPTAGQFGSEYSMYWYVGPKTEHHSSFWDTIRDPPPDMWHEWPCTQRPNGFWGQKFLTKQQLRMLRIKAL